MNQTRREFVETTATLAGVGLITGRMGGLLWLVPTILICLIWSTYNAWTLMIDAIDQTQDK